MSLPLIRRSPAIVVFALLLPIFKVVAALAKFTVVAFAISKLNVVAVVVISPPFTAKSPGNTNPVVVKTATLGTLVTLILTFELASTATLLLPF